MTARVDQDGAPAGAAPRPEPDQLAGWRVDPSGDHPFRYHDGERWTDVVLTGEGRLRRRPLPTAN